MRNTVNIANLTGLNGGTVIANTTAVTAAASRSFTALLVVEDTVLTALTSNLTNGSALVGKTLPAGLVLYGRITAVQLATGTVIAYND